MPSIPLRSLLDITQSSHRVEILPVRERDIFCASKSPADKSFWLLSDGAKEGKVWTPLSGSRWGRWLPRDLKMRECLLSLRVAVGREKRCAEVGWVSTAPCFLQEVELGSHYCCYPFCHLPGLLYQVPSADAAHRSAILPQDMAASCLGPRHFSCETPVGLTGSIISYLCRF